MKNPAPKFLIRFARLLCASLLLVFGVRSASAFALLGPFAPWMTAQLGYQDGVSIGGPMNIGEGYRWNVPVITYGYDQSFIDFFGTNGVAAVESAIQILNDLPPASQIVLTNYPLSTTKVNYRARAQNLVDLKSTALSLLLEQMGLAQPTRSVYCLHDFEFVGGVPTYTVLLRNFDPDTRQPSTFVNGILYDDIIVLNWNDEVVGSNVYFGPWGIPPSPVIAVDAVEQTPDPSQEALADNAVADNVPDNIPAGYFSTSTFGEPGRYFFDLTHDDLGGLIYLLNSNNVALESLIPGVSGAGTNASNFVNTALRPGVEKITFQRMDYISPTQLVFPIITNQYVDSYYTNGFLQQQTLQRVITQPDILFTANYIGWQIVSRTGTSNWVNNGAPESDGPGVVQPPIVINFNRLGPSLFSQSSYYSSTNVYPPALLVWGSYDGTTNSPISYPASAATNSTTVYFYLYPQYSLPSSWLTPIQPTARYSWTFTGPSNAVYLFQTSSNLQDWVTLTNINNLGGTFSYEDYIWTNTPQRFFRTVPQ